MPQSSTITNFDLGELLDQESPEVNLIDALQLAERFGINAKGINALAGERDRNFYLMGVDQNEYVLKVVHPAESIETIDFQCKALLHIAERDPGVPVPRLYTSCDSHSPFLHWKAPLRPERAVIAISFLQGVSMHQYGTHQHLRTSVGKTLAHLNISLLDFSHSGQSRDLLWDSKLAHRVSPLLHEVDESLRVLCEQALGRFKKYVVPAMPALGEQVIHNDLNPYNLLIDTETGTRVVGIIDFGDMVSGPRIQDLATACAYQIHDGIDLLESISDVVSGYHQVSPLNDYEMEVLLDWIGARLALTIAISSWRALRHPENATYIVKNRAQATASISRLHSLSRDDSIDQLLTLIKQKS